MKTKQITVIFVLIALISINLKAQIKVTSTGSVGVKTMTPVTDFQVVGNSVFTSAISTIGSAAYIRGNNTFSSAINPDYTWYNNDQSGIFHPSSNVIGFSIGGVERARFTNLSFQINSSGDWTRTIWVNATHRDALGYHMRYGGSDNFYVHASGWIYYQGGYITSDKIFKKDIVTIESALDKVLQLRGVTYKSNYSDSMSVFNTGETLMGLIAQDVEPIVPEVVKTLPNGTKAIAYQNLIGLLIEAIKEQQTRIDQFEGANEKSGNLLEDEINAYSKSAKNKLYQNHPNPFNQSTIIKYELSVNAQTATIMVFNMQGNLIRAIENLDRNTGQITIKSGELVPGMYIYSLIVDGKEIDTKRMILTN